MCSESKKYLLLAMKGLILGLNVIKQKQMPHQIDPLIKILIVLACGAIWQPVFMPLLGKNQR